MIQEKQVQSASGWVVLLVLIVLSSLFTYGMVRGAETHNTSRVILFAFLLVVDMVMWGGFFVVNPNEGRVLQLFGAYKGTDRTPGFRWNHPFYTKRRISLRVRNFESARLKVNDHDGNPIEIAAVVVWKVVDSAEALFQVDDYVNFVSVQSESALRNMA